MGTAIEGTNDGRILPKNDPAGVTEDQKSFQIDKIDSVPVEGVSLHAISLKTLETSSGCHTTQEGIKTKTKTEKKNSFACHFRF
jgi:hypothetical protein